MWPFRLARVQAFVPVVVLAAVSTTLAPERAAHAVDPFEIQVYDGTANPAGGAGLEVHANGVAEGVATAAPPEIAPNHVVHLTFEPSYGLTAFWEVGAYLQTAVPPDGGYDFAGVKLRTKVVTPPDWRPALRLGANLEVSYLPDRYDRDNWGVELRPIAAWEDARWLFAVNPIVDFSFTGAAPTFEPAAMAVIKIAGVVSVGFEYYAAFGSIASPSPWLQQEQYLYEVANLLDVRDLEVNVGVGEGLTAASNALTVKAIVGYGFDWFARPARR